MSLISNNRQAVIQLESLLNTSEATFDAIYNLEVFNIDTALPLIDKVNALIQTINTDDLSSNEFYGLAKKIDAFKRQCKNLERIIKFGLRTGRISLTSEQSSEAGSPKTPNQLETLIKSRLELEKTQAAFKKTIRELAAPLALAGPAISAPAKTEMNRSQTLEAWRQINETLTNAERAFTSGDFDHMQACAQKAIPLLEQARNQIQSFHPEKLTTQEFDLLNKKIIEKLQYFGTVVYVLKLNPAIEKQLADNFEKAKFDIGMARIDLERKKEEIRAKADKTYSNRVLINGICNGEVMALMEQSKPIPTEKTEARARFIQPCYRLNKSRTEFDALSAGRIILEGKTRARPLVLQKVATRFGFANYSDWVKSIIGTDDIASQLNTPRILEIVGHVGLEIFREYKKIYDLPMPDGSVDAVYQNRIKDNGIYCDLLYGLSKLLNAHEKENFENPENFLQKTPLNHYELILQDEPNLSKFKTQLETSLEKPGDYRVVLRTKDFGHAVYISFDPYALDGPYKFCDINDRTLDSLPIVRSFRTKSELLLHFHEYLQDNYIHGSSATWHLSKIEKRAFSAKEGSPIERLSVRDRTHNNYGSAEFTQRAFPSYDDNFDLLKNQEMEQDAVAIPFDLILPSFEELYAGESFGMQEQVPEDFSFIDIDKASEARTQPKPSVPELDLLTS